MLLFLLTKSFFSPLSLVCCFYTGEPGAFQGWHCPDLCLWTDWMPCFFPGRSLWQGHTTVFKNAWHLQWSALWICKFFFFFFSSDIDHPSSSITLWPPFIYHQSRLFALAIFQAPITYICDICVMWVSFFAGAIFLSQQEPHRKTEVPHIWHTNTRW